MCHHLNISFRLKNNQGKTPGDLAKERNKTEICLKIQEFSEDNNPQEDFLQEEKGEGEDDKHSSLSVERSEVSNILECPVCLDTMIKVIQEAQCAYVICATKYGNVQVRIYQCRNGHNVCERCSNNPALVTCPQ